MKANQYASIPIPDELTLRVDRAIERGAVKEKRKKAINIIGVAAAVLIIFISSVNISPAFAGYMKNIPGLSYFVELVKFDKGLKSAIENDYVQVVEKSKKDKDIKFTIRSLIFDRRQLIISYTIETTGDYMDLKPHVIEITDKDGNLLEVASNTSYTPDSEFKMKKARDGIMEFNAYDEGKFPTDMVLKCREFYEMDVNSGVEKSKIEGNWDISFKIDEKFMNAMPITKELNENYCLGPVHFNVEKVDMYPTAVYVTISFDKTDKDKFAGFKNLRLADENGRTYEEKGATIVSDYKRIIRFESNYFFKSKKLSLKADGIYHIPFESQYIVFDLKNNRITNDGGYNIEYLQYRKNVAFDDKEYDLELSFNIRDEEILKNCQLPGSQYGGIDFSYAEDGSGNKCHVMRDFSSQAIKKDNLKESFIERHICFSEMKKIPSILRLKVGYASKGTDGDINVEIR